MPQPQNQSDSSLHVLESDEFTLPGWELVGVTNSGERLAAIPVREGALQIGRRADADVVVFDPTVSQRHAEVFVADGQLFVRDLNSTNGTHLNGDRVRSAVSVSDGDQIFVGNFVIEVHATHAASSFEVLETDTIVSLDHWLDGSFDKLLEKGGLHFLFQPIIRLEDFQPIGFEGFVRSIVPEFESPNELFRLAKRKNVTDELSRTCRILAARDAEALPKDSRVFLKMHDSERLDEALIDSLGDLRVNSPAMRFVLELGEANLTDAEDLQAFQSGLSELGIELAFDDFGVGRSRLKELLTIQPAYVKFDQSLISEPDLTSQQIQWIRSLVGSIRGLGIQTIAEGIKSNKALENCREIGFDLGQGHALGTPAPSNRWSG